MKVVASAALMLCLCGAAGASGAATGSPISKVIEMLSDLEAKIIKEGVDAQKVYEELAEFCEDRSRELGWQIKGLKEETEENLACFTAEENRCDECATKKEDCVGELTKDEADVKNATAIRKAETEDFAKKEADLVEIIDMLERAIAIIEREMSKSYTLLQANSANSLSAALKAILQALDMSMADAGKLAAFVQSSSQEEDTDTEAGAPDPTAYKSHSSSIVDTLYELLNKAKGELEELRAKETAAQRAFEMLVLGLKGEITADQKCIDDASTCLGECAEEGAKCKDAYDKGMKDLALAEKMLAELHADCMGKAQDFELEVKSRGEELKALAEAKKVIKDSSGGAEEITYGLNQEDAVSFVQTSRLRSTTRAGLANFEVARFVRSLAKKQRSAALAQLAMRIATAVRSSATSGDDPFAKVKGLITDMIEKLLKEAEAEATHKAFCDKEMAESAAKKADKTDEIEKLTAKIDKMTATSAQLKDEIAQLQKELAELAATQAEMDKIRAEEKAVFETNKAELEEGLQGVKLALKILRDYYSKEDKAHVAAEGAASGIIGLLEVVESDLMKGLAEAVSAEESAAAKYEEETKDNEILKVTMEQDVKYKTKEAKELDEAVAEAKTDLTGVQAELDAVLEYIKKLEDQCIAKPEPYEERVRRREAEIAGLKEALEILSGEAVLIQKAAVRRLRRHA